MQGLFRRAQVSELPLHMLHGTRGFLCGTADSTHGRFPVHGGTVGRRTWARWEQSEDDERVGAHYGGLFLRDPDLVILHDLPDGAAMPEIEMSQQRAVGGRRQVALRPLARWIAMEDPGCEMTWVSLGGGDPVVHMHSSALSTQASFPPPPPGSQVSHLSIASARSS